MLLTIGPSMGDGDDLMTPAWAGSTALPASQAASVEWTDVLGKAFGGAVASGLPSLLQKLGITSRQASQLTPAELQALQMAQQRKEEQERNNMLLIFGGLAAVVLVGAVLLRRRDS